MDMRELAQVRSKRRGRARSVVVAAACVVASLLALSSPAFAGSTHYCTGSLLAKWGCGDGGAHTGNVYVEIVTDHTGCASLSTFGGYLTNPNYGTSFGGSVQIVGIACTSGSGTNGGSAYTTNHHGAVWNPNNATTDNISDAHITY